MVVLNVLDRKQPPVLPATEHAAKQAQPGSYYSWPNEDDAIAASPRTMQPLLPPTKKSDFPAYTILHVAQLPIKGSGLHPSCSGARELW